jgi:hypothetical protein
LGRVLAFFLVFTIARLLGCVFEATTDFGGDEAGKRDFVLTDALLFTVWSLFLAAVASCLELDFFLTAFDEEGEDEEEDEDDASDNDGFLDEERPFEGGGVAALLLPAPSSETDASSTLVEGSRMLLRAPVPRFAAAGRERAALGLSWAVDSESPVVPPANTDTPRGTRRCFGWGRTEALSFGSSFFLVDDDIEELRNTREQEQTSWLQLQLTGRLTAARSSFVRRAFALHCHPSSRTERCRPFESAWQARPFDRAYYFYKSVGEDIECARRRLLRSPIVK